MSVPNVFRSLAGFLLLLPWAAQAQFTQVWQLGTDDGSQAEFGLEWTLDDDFTIGEPPAQFERAVTSSDPFTRVHFDLAAAQYSAQARLRLLVDMYGQGWWNESTQTWMGVGWHDVEIRVNGVLVKTDLQQTQSALLVAEFRASDVATRAVDNVVTITRTGGSPASSWTQFDWLALEAHATAYADADGDGMPRFWEEDNGFSDNRPADAALDSDADGLTNGQEYSAGTDPRRADTDGDGLCDGEEHGVVPPGPVVAGIAPRRADIDGEVHVVAAPGAVVTGTNPLLADTDGDGLSDYAEARSVPPGNPLLPDADGDGAPDAWELHMRTDPALAASVPAAFGQAVGLKFVSALRPHAAPGWRHVAGKVPQFRWNVTRPIDSWSETSGNTSFVTGPAPGVLQTAAGTDSGITAAWISQGTSASGNSGSPNQVLLDGFLRTNPDTSLPVVLTLGGITWAGYDLLVYAGADYDEARGWAQVSSAANPVATRRWFATLATSPQKDLVEALTTQAQLDAAIGSETNAQEIERIKRRTIRPANVVVFRGLTGASATVEVRPDGGWVGICAVQIVDAAADRDADGMTDSYEFAHGLRAGDPADAPLDADGDGLTNLQESQLRSDARSADTDRDGLGDAAELASNILTPDSDGDGLSDHAEVTAVRPTNPNAADSDGDGVPDRTELQNGTDAMSNASVYPPVPVFTPAAGAIPATWRWTVDAQIVWDHTRAHLVHNAWNEDRFIDIIAVNGAVSNDWALSLGLRWSRHLTYLFYSTPASGFSAGGAPGSHMWMSDVPPVDLTAQLGFSGYGPCDLSDRLRFALTATRGAGGNGHWTLVYEILNLDRPPGAQVVATHTVTQSTAAANVDAGNVVWGDGTSPNPAGEPEIQSQPGVTVYLGWPALSTLPSFAAHVDTDNDGMTDAWELSITPPFNPNSAADAVQDADGDGRTNRQECLDGTNPRAADTDGDGVNDGAEAAGLSDALLVSSRPPFYFAPPPGGEDFNGNGLSDAWELWTGSWSLTAAGDADGDGMSNAYEASAGTNAFDASSRLWIDSTLQDPLWRLHWPDIAHKRHRLFQGSALTGWSVVPGAPSVVNGFMSQAVPAPSQETDARKFYRAGIDDLDTDGDGLSDWSENFIGTNRLAADSARSPAAHGGGVDPVPTAGDYAWWAEQMLGARASGGWPGASGAPPAEPISRVQASRFLTQATFGPTLEDIEHLRTSGYSTWIAQQIAAPPSLHRPYIESIYSDFRGPRTDHTYSANQMDSFVDGTNATTPFFRAAVAGPDQLRQRIAFALSQILVVSRRDAALEGRPLAVCDYYDIFVRHAFGNYCDVLLEVSLHPVMGRYLSHLGNQKANPALNQYPDENFARELMQLFTIGLWELNSDGTRRLNAGQEPIPTYSNTEITELARVFTGLWVAGQQWGQGGWQDASYAMPMVLHADRHDFGIKTLPGGSTIPARAPTQENAVRDVRDAVRHLFNHANTPPFVCRQLIQFLVTSNPSPAYVQRVQQVFVNNGQGVRGDLAAVVHAILLDAEARDPIASHATPSFGKLKEPVIRAMHLARIGQLAKVPNLVWWTWGGFAADSLQEPTYSPSVFNFYRPDYKAPGLLTQQNLSGPVFQITDSYSSIAFPNRIWDLVERGFWMWGAYSYPLDVAAEEELAGSPELLVDRVNLLLCGGRLTAASRDIILTALADVSPVQRSARAKLAVYLAASCPEGAVQR